MLISHFVAKKIKKCEYFNNIDKIYTLSIEYFRDHASGGAAPVGFDGVEFGRKDFIVSGDNRFLMRS